MHAETAVLSQNEAGRSGILRRALCVATVCGRLSEEEGDTGSRGEMCSARTRGFVSPSRAEASSILRPRHSTIGHGRIIHKRAKLLSRTLPTIIRRTNQDSLIT